MRLPTRSPFLKSTELVELHQLLFNPPSSSSTLSFDQQRIQGVELISLYLNRSNCPHAIESTCFLIQAQILDHNLHFHPSNTSFLSSSQADISSRLSYSTSIIRFVNSIVDSEQTGFYAQSINSIAERIGLPLAFVELRHASTHEELPSLNSLRQATVAALEWLDVHYWRPTLNSLFPQSKVDSEPHQSDPSSSSQIHTSSSTGAYQEPLPTSEPFKISFTSISNLRNLLKTYKKISKLVSKDFSLKGSLNREIGEICKEIEDWIKQVGRSAFDHHHRARNGQSSSDFNPNLIQIGSYTEREGSNFNPNRFNRKRRRGDGLDYSDQEELSSNEREIGRNDEIITFGLEIFLKELLQIGGLVPLGVGKRMGFKGKDKVEKGKGKGKEVEVELEEVLNQQPNENDRDIDEDQDQLPDQDEEESSSEFTFNGIQILPSTIINQWSTLLNHLSKTFNDFFVPLLISQMIECLKSGIPSIEIESEEIDSTKSNNVPSQSFPKGYRETISSWLIHLLELKKSHGSSYGMISAVISKGWESLNDSVSHRKNGGVRRLKNSELDFRKPKNRLALVCLSFDDHGRSALPILNYLASTPIIPSVLNSNSDLISLEPEKISSSSNSASTQDETLSKILKPLIEKLESSTHSIVKKDSIVSTERDSQDQVQVSGSSHSSEITSETGKENGTGFEDSLSLMRERLESLGKKNKPQADVDSNQRGGMDDGIQTGIKRARFSDDLESGQSSSSDDEEVGMSKSDKDEGESDVDDDGDEEEIDTDHDSVHQEDGESRREAEEGCIEASSKRVEVIGWRLPRKDEWKPCPIGMLRGEVPDLHL